MNMLSVLTDILFVGNSLVGPDLPVLVEAGLRQMQQPAEVAAQVINGAPLKFSFENASSGEGVDARAELAKGGTRALILNEAVPLAAQLQWNDTPGQIAAFAGLAREANPEVRVYLYEVWHSRKSGPGTEMAGDPGAGVPWRERLTADLPLWEGAIRDAEAKGAAGVTLIPAGQAMARLADAVDAGKVPGISSMDAFFSDDIHLSDRGVYFVALVHLAALTGTSPEGLPAKLTRSWKSRDAVIDEATAAALQTIAWETVSGYTSAPAPQQAEAPETPPLDDTSEAMAAEPANASDAAQTDEATATPAVDTTATAQADPADPAKVDAPLPDAPVAALPAGLTPVTNPNLGLGLNGVADWTVQQPFLDVMKTSREWTGHLPGQFGGWDHAKLESAGYLDANGWPKAMPPELTGISALFLTDLPANALGVAGRYLLTHTGKGSLRVEGRAQVVAQSDGQVIFDYTPGEGSVIVTLDAIDRDDPIRDIIVVRQDRAALLAQGQWFNPDWLDRIRGVKTIRLMDWMKTNDSPLVSLDDRPKTADYTWARIGVPVEVMIELANTLNADPWFTMPHLADDALVRAYAEAARDGLKPGLKAHVEYSNEVWNWQFAQAGWAEAQGKARWGRESTWVQFYALRAAEVADIWTAAYGDAAKDRLVRVIATQTGWLGLEEQILQAPDVIAEGRPAPATRFDAYAITGYFSGMLGSEGKVAMVRDLLKQSEAEAKKAGEALGLSGTALADHIAAHQHDTAIAMAAEELSNGALTGDPADSVADWLTRTLPHHAAVAKKNGLTLMMYEGGTHVVGMGGAVDDAALTRFFQDLNYAPAMAALYAQMMEGWAKTTDAPFMAFVDVAAPSKWGSWGALRHLGDDNPRWQVLAKGCTAC